MFSAIMKYGWEQIRHYVLFEGLDEYTAHVIEALLIREWRTCMKGKGYNTVIPRIEPPDGFVMPEYTKKRVRDNWDEPVDVRIYKKYKEPKRRSNCCKPVRLIETGEVFDSATEAAHSFMISPKGVSHAAKTSGSCGTCIVEDNERGIWRFVPAHWEYIEENDNEEEDVI